MSENSDSGEHSSSSGENASYVSDKDHQGTSSLTTKVMWDLPLWCFRALKAVAHVC